MKRQTYRLGDLCRMVKGQSPTLKTTPGLYPLVVTAEYRRTSDTWQLEGPAVCIPLISSTGHGDAALHRVHYQEGKFALANLLVALIPNDPTVCDARYLYHLLMTRKDQLLVPLMQGTANVSLKERDIAGVEISLPPLAEQQFLVGQINQITTQVNEIRKARRAQEIETRAMLLGAFSKLIGTAPRRPVKDIAPLIRRPVVIEFDKSYPELGIRSFGNGTFHKPALTGLELGNKRIFEIHANDLLFSNVFAWEGAIAVAQPSDHGRYGSHRFMSCKPCEGVATANFLCFFFLTPEGLDLISEASPGGALRNRTLGLEALSNIHVPLPSYEDQIWFDRLQGEVGAAKKLQEVSDRELDSLLPAVHDRALKGEL